MLDEQVLKGNWDEVKNKLKEKWDTLSDNDLRTIRGNVSQLINRIHKKTGESRQTIEAFLEEVGDPSFLSHLREQMSATAQQAMEGAREGYQVLREKYDDTEHLVEEHPASSVAVAFGLGFLSGVTLAVLLHHAPQPSRLTQARSTAEDVGKHILDALSGMIPDSIKNMRRG
ncbi:MAG: hypothetical protein K8T91_08715 [Planctomycetes bacterium]|nr:hypothetical protein [Planctomycetota bacterium]